MKAERLAVTAVIFFVLFPVFGQTVPENNSSNDSLQPPSAADDFSDLDSVFADASDTTALPAENTAAPKEQTAPSLRFSGYFSTELGALYYLSSREFSPAVSFQNLLNFSADPSPDIAIRGSVLTSFPSLSFSLYTLYVNYILYDHLFLTVGKKDERWGNSFIFDTNILDDESSDNWDDNLLDEKTYDPDDSFFIASCRVPFGPAGFGFIAMDTSIGTLNASAVSYAGYVSFTAGPVSFKFFGRKWAAADCYRYHPAVGLELTSTIGDSIHLYGQGVIHLAVDTEEITRSKVTGGFAYLHTNPDFGIEAEYQGIYVMETGLYTNVALYVGWNHIAGSRIGAGCKWYHTFEERSGGCMPALVIGISPVSSVKFGLKEYYGSSKKSYAGAELSLSTTY